MKIEKNNLSYWQEQDPSRIVTGLDWDVLLIKEYLDPLRGLNPALQVRAAQIGVLELGAGRGELADLLREKSEKYQVSAIDLNPAAMFDLNKRTGARVGVGNAAKWAEGFEKESILELEAFEGVTMKALTPSLLGKGGKEWMDVMDAADMWLMPGGYLFFYDIVRGDVEYSSLVESLGSETASSMREQWTRRYEANQVAMNDSNLPPRLFAVGRPGTSGKKLEVGTAREIQRLVNNPSLFERFAQHVDLGEVTRYLSEVRKLELVKERFGHYRSRGCHGLIAPTVFQVWKKPLVYRYHHLMSGLSVDDPKLQEQAVGKMAEIALATSRGWGSYFELALALVWGNAPASQKESLLELMNKFHNWWGL